MPKDFDSQKCLVNLKLALNRIRLHYQKKAELNELTKREIAQLLREKKLEQARIRAVTAIHTDYYLEVLQVLETHVEIVATRMDIIAAQLTCPLDLKEAVCSIIYAAPFLDNSPELLVVRSLFIKKYGKDFPQDCVTSCCVNKKVKRGLARDMPDDALINYYLATISGQLDADNELPTADKKQSTDNTSDSTNTQQNQNQQQTKTTTTPSASSNTANTTNTTKPQISQPTSQSTSRPEPLAKAPNTPSLQASITQTHSPTSTLSPSTVSNAIPIDTIQRGTVRKDLSGNFWLITSPNGQPVPGQSYLFIPSKLLNGAGDGDVVEAAPLPSNPRVGKVLRIVGSPQTAIRKPPPVRKAVFRIDLNGNSWAVVASPGPDGSQSSMIYIAPKDRHGAEDGDFVAVQLHNRNDGKLSGQVIQILHRRPPKHPLQPETPPEEVQGPLMIDINGDGSLQHPKTNLPIFIPRHLLGGARDADFVRVAIIEPSDGKEPAKGQVVAILQPRPQGYIEPYSITVKVLIDSDGNGHCPNVKNLGARNDPGAQFVFIPKDRLAGAKHGDMVIVQVNPNHRSSTGSILGQVASVVESASTAAYDVSATIQTYEDDDAELFASPVPSLPPGLDKDALEENVSSTLDKDELDELSAMWDSGLVIGDNARNDAITASQRLSAERPTVSIDRVLVIDIGSGLIKAGYANQPVPTHVMPTVVGRPQARAQMVMQSKSQSEFDSAEEVYGNDALLKKGIMSLEYPFDRGLVADWHSMSKLLSHLFSNVLRIDPTTHTVVFTEPNVSPIANKERFAKIFFHELKVPQIYYARASVLALNAAGFTTGLVIDIGHTLTTITPIYEGFAVTNSTRKLHLAGYDITEQLARLLAASTGINFSSQAGTEMIKQVKEKLAYVASNPEEEEKKFANPSALRHLQKQFKLPDDTVITIGEEMWRCCEILFDPKQVGMEESEGLHHLVHKCVMECDVQLRRELLKNIVLCGGSTLLPGMAARLERELNILFPHHKIVIHDMAKRHYLSWIGGSLLACSQNLADILITQEMFNKMGPSILNTKCL